MIAALLLVYLCLALDFSSTEAFTLTHHGTISSPSTRIARATKRSQVPALRMAQNPEPPFLASKVVFNEREAEGLRTIRIEVADDVIKPFIFPGQYCQIKGTAPEARASFYAICSPPNQGNILQFLIKDNENNAFVTKAAVGTEVLVTPAQGRGFQFEQYFEKYKFDYAVNTVVMMACGSGLAPVASYIDGNAGWGEMGINSLSPRKGVLYIGAKTEKHLPLAAKYAEWESKGVKVIPCISQPANSSGWTGRTGYVQDALRADGIPAPRNCGALLCGHKDMTNAAKEVMLVAGIFEGRILFNF